jgi:hypothetical protein
MQTTERPSRALVTYLRVAALADPALSPVVYLCDRALAGDAFALDRIGAMFVEDDLRRSAPYLRLLMKGVSRGDARDDHGASGCDDVSCGARPDCAGCIAVIARHLNEIQG